MRDDMQLCGTAALVGLPNVGKSTLLNAFVGEKIAAATFRPQTTRRVVRGVVTRDNAQIIFVDTPGLLNAKQALQSFMVAQARAAIHNVDVVVLVADATENPETTLALLKRDLDTKKKPILVLNKIDLFNDKRELLPVIQKWSEAHLFAAILPVSAHKREGLDAVLQEIVGILPKGQFLHDPDTMTDSPEKEIVAELIREKAMLVLNNEVPYQLAVTIESFDEARRQDDKKPLVEIGAVLHVERDSQKRIVIGAKGDKIKSIGVMARKDLERLLGCQVMLRLFVRVEPDWSSSAKALGKLGYR